MKNGSRRKGRKIEDTKRRGQGSDKGIIAWFHDAMMS